MGEVYRAQDPRPGRDVAIKVIASDGPPGADRVQRFEQEARAVAALGHPSILAVYDVGTHDGQAYVVFELLEGETLRDRLQRGPLPVRKAVELGGQIGQGLAAAHARGVVHRDLKPANLFLTRDGRVKILDFGLAKLVEPTAPEASVETTPTVTGAFLGTPGYAAPEQVRAAPVDHRVDLFALGAVLYEMATGKKAFKGATAADTLSAVLNRDPPSMDGASGGGGEAVPAALERHLAPLADRHAFAADDGSGTLRVFSRPRRAGDDLSIRVVHAEVLHGVFGLDDAAVRDGAVAFPKHAPEAAREVRAGRGSVALYLNPLAAEDVFRVTGAGEILPQKSTFFHPKLPSGLVFRLLDAEDAG
jgi:serine/threonine protein kinase